MTATGEPREPRRVLLVSYEYPPLGGGGGVVFRDLAENLAERMQVTVLTSARRGLAGRECAGNVEIVRTPVWMRDADLYVSTTLHEGFGIAFLEAMTTGLPVICYDCGGQTDFLSKEFSYLVPLGDKDLFRERLAGLCKDTKLRARMGEAARREATNYSVDRLSARYLQIYRECLSRRPS